MPVDKSQSPNFMVCNVHFASASLFGSAFLVKNGHFRGLYDWETLKVILSLPWN